MTKHKDGEKGWVVWNDLILPVLVAEDALGSQQLYVDGKLFCHSPSDFVYASLEAASAALRAKAFERQSSLRAEALKHEATIEQNIAMARLQMQDGWQ